MSRASSSLVECHPSTDSNAPGWMNALANALLREWCRHAQGSIIPRGETTKAAPARFAATWA